MPNQLVDHFFRHESGKLIASLVRFFGLRHFDLVEDMVQAALVEALQAWKTHGIPDQPAAWVYRVAKNRVLDTLRRDTNFRDKAETLFANQKSEQLPELDQLFNESQIEDNQLRMIFACCHPSLPTESAVPLTLKTLCGFNEKEIAKGMLLSRENVRKRIYRAKQTMIEQNVSLELPSGRQLPARLHYVHNVLYLMFNEGYSTTDSDQAIRGDVCEEAARLCHLLTEHPHCNTQATHALLALMLLHASRFDSRTDQNGELVRLADQDRSLWDQRMIDRARHYMRAAGSKATSLYHLEASIAYQHCAAKSLDETNWSAIIAAYDTLIQRVPSPVYKLNRAIAVGKRDGPDTAIAILNKLQSDSMLQRSHLLEATFGELYREKGNRKLAQTHFRNALAKTNSIHQQNVIKRRIADCQTS